MFDTLSDKLQQVFKNISGRGKLTEKNMREGLREIRMALLEADVNYKVVKDFVAAVEQKAVGQRVIESVSPAQQIVKIVHDELVELMGEKNAALETATSPPSIVMMVGLQGSGKTTGAGKLSKKLRSKGHNPLLVAADVYRPAAVKQLEIVASDAGVPCFSMGDGIDPVTICKAAMRESRAHGHDFVIMDTAGRLHIDTELMAELRHIKQAVKAHEILFVADAMTGQDAVNAAKRFHEELGLTGVMLTKLDGDARGGAAISVRKVAGCPIKFVGTGEKLDALEPFHPERMASRILGMGDVVTLVERAQQTIDEKQAEKWEKKLRKQQFTFEDFKEQLGNLKKMGPLEDVLAMVPGMGQLKNMGASEEEFVKVEAIINSMTLEERRKPHIINGSRRRRIASGSGTSVQEVNRLIKQFGQVKKMMKGLAKPGKMKQMAQMMR